MSSPADLGACGLTDTSLVVLLMRVHGLWQKDKRLGIFLALLAVVSICLGVALLSVQPGVSESIWNTAIQLQPHILDRVLSNLFNCVSVVYCWHCSLTHHPSKLRRA